MQRLVEISLLFIVLVVSIQCNRSDVTIHKEAPTVKWSFVAIGNSHTIALKDDGSLWAWGANHYMGELGDGTTKDKASPIQIGTDSDWQAIAAGPFLI